MSLREMRNKIELLIKEVLKEKFEQDFEIKLDVPDVAEYGDFSLACFVFVKAFRKAPQMIAEEIKALIVEKNPEYLAEINTVGAYLNFKLKKEYYFSKVISQILADANNYGKTELGKNKRVLVEFSSPNTNKPLHLGHIRNNLLGDAVSRIYQSCGYEVVKANLLNDRGIHICKAMVAWQKYGNGETPASSGIKGDHLVGKYYVIFEKKLKEEQDAFFNKTLDPIKYDGGYLFLTENKESYIYINYSKYVENDINLSKNEKNISCDPTDLMSSMTKYEKYFESVSNNESEIALIIDLSLNLYKSNSKLKGLRAFLVNFNDIKKDKFIEEVFYPKSNLLKEARNMLVDWEANFQTKLSTPNLYFEVLDFKDDKKVEIDDKNYCYLKYNDFSFSLHNPYIIEGELTWIDKLKNLSDNFNITLLETDIQKIAYEIGRLQYNEMKISLNFKEVEVIKIWKMMNEWVVEGFNQSYKNLGISFDKYYFESETYKLGRDYANLGVKKGVCYQKEDNSVWIELKEKKFGNDKLLLRKDGTSVYMTQDIGTTFLKFNDFNLDKAIWVVGSEQEYHFQVLFKIMELLGFEKYKECYHLSYGMIYLPEGKMKSREGKVVDADDFVLEMKQKAKEEIVSRNRPFSEEELEKISEVVGLGALKFYILQYGAKTDFVFDPKASIDFNGKTGPYIQYTHARISSLLKVLADVELSNADFSSLKNTEDFTLLKLLEQFSKIIENACTNNNTSVIGEYLYALASAFNSFYSKADNRIKEMSIEEQKPRLAVAKACKIVLSNGLKLLGIDAPEQM